MAGAAWKGCLESCLGKVGAKNSTREVVLLFTSVYYCLNSWGVYGCLWGFPFTLAHLLNRAWAPRLARDDGFIISVQTASHPTLAWNLSGMAKAPGSGEFSFEIDRQRVGQVILRISLPRNCTGHPMYLG